MRLKVTLHNPRPCAIPIDHYDHLTAVVYHLLGASDTEYARFLHDEGYDTSDPGKRFKLFVFSSLRAPAARRRLAGNVLQLAPGPIEWLIASPIEPFLNHCATGLLSSTSLRVGHVDFPLTSVEALPTPELTEATDFHCLTPIVASKPLKEGATYYYRPRDIPDFSEAIRRNLLRKHETVYGCEPDDDQLRIEFDPAYLETHRGGTKKVTYRDIDIVGALAPFRATGSVELMRLMLDAGAGEKSSWGMGMVDVVGKADKSPKD